MATFAYASPQEKGLHYLHRLICEAVLLFLIAPILLIITFSFNSVPFFTYLMPGLSLRCAKMEEHVADALPGRHALRACRDDGY